MKFEKTGNLGKVDLLDRLVAQKYFSGTIISEKKNLQKLADS